MSRAQSDNNQGAVQGGRGRNWTSRGPVYGYGSWGGRAELSESYRHALESLPLLTQEEELQRTKEFNEARLAISKTLDEYPRVLACCLASVQKGRERQLLLSFFGNDDDDIMQPELEARILKLVQALPGQLESGDGVPEAFKELQQCCQWTSRLYVTALERLFDKGYPNLKMSPKAMEQLLERLRPHREHMYQAKNALVEGNLRLVVRIARSYACRAMTIEDLVQEGNIGLMRAVEHFDASRKHKFCTYAGYWIRQAISRSLTNFGRAIRVPANIIYDVARIRRCEQEMLHRDGELPSAETIAQALNMSPSRVRALMKMTQQPMSLQSISNDERNWEETLPESLSVAHSERERMDEIRASLEQSLEALDERERNIIIRHFGLMGQPSETLEQLGLAFNLSSERIRQIEMEAIKKMRRLKG